MSTISPILVLCALSIQIFSLIETHKIHLYFPNRMSSKLGEELLIASKETDSLELEMEKAIRETMEMLLDKTSKANPVLPSDLGDFNQNGPSEIGRLVIAECSSAECSKSNSPMPEGPIVELQFKGTSMPLNGTESTRQMPVGTKTMPKIQQTPKMTTNAPSSQFAQSSTTTITLKKMLIQPTPVAKILPKPPAVSQAAKMQQHQEQPKTTQSQTDQKGMAMKMTTKLIRICANETITSGPKMVMANSTKMLSQIAGQISSQMPTQIISQNLQNFGQNGDNQIAANNRPSQYLPIRPKIRKSSNANNGAKMAAATSTPPTSNTSNVLPKIDQITEDHLAATVNKVAAGMEISPKQEEKMLLATNTESANPIPPTAHPSDKSKATAKPRKKKPAASILPVSISNGTNIGGAPMGIGGSCAFSFPSNVQSQPQIVATTASSTGIFATATHNPQFALAPNGNLMAVSGGMTHYLIRQQPNPATSAVSGHFIPFMPPGQFFISPVHQISELKQQNNTNNCFGQKGTAIGSDIAHRGLNGPTTTSFSSIYSSSNSCATTKANKHHSQIVPPPKMMIDNSPQTNYCFGNLPTAVDEEENEPPPVLDKPQPSDDEPEPAMMPQNGGNGDTARLLESIFQKEAKIIRDRFTGFNRRKGGPIVHEIDGFRIEEDIEPFPVENKKLLDALKEGKSLTNSPEEKEGKNIDEKKKKATAKKSHETPPPVAKKGRSSEGVSSSTVAPGSSISSSAKVKGRKRELQGLLEMDFGPGKTPFQTSDPDEYTEEVLIEAKKHARLMSEERPHSSSSKSKRDKERSSQQGFSANLPTKEKRTPIGQQKEGGNDKNGSSGELKRGGRSSSMEYETEEEGHCHNCGKSFEDVGRCQGHEQYCSRECHKAMKKKRKKLKISSREDSMNNGNGTGGNNNDESPSATNSTVTAISQQKWTSPLGSAFAAVQPQVAAQTSLSNAGSVGTSPNSGGPQTSNAPMFYAPAGPSQSQIQQNQQQIQHQAQHIHQIIPQQMSYPQHISSPHQYLGPMPSNYFHPQQFVHTAAAQQMIQPPAGSSSAPTAFFGHFPVPGTMVHQLTQSSHSAGFHHRSPPQLGQSPPLTPGTPAIPGKMAGEIDLLLARGIHTWTPEEVAKWVNFVTNSANNGEAFVQQEIDGSSLLLLNCEQLQNELKLKLGPAVKLQNALNSHKAKYQLL